MKALRGSNFGVMWPFMPNYSLIVYIDIIGIINLHNYAKYIATYTASQK